MAKKQYLVISYQEEDHRSYITNDLKKFVIDYHDIDGDDEQEVKETMDHFLNTEESEHEVYEVIKGKLVKISRS